ncbi:malate dehydrogenase [Siccirubricoccus deserti]|uniref:Ldh family oxidoreductase n=1 Tax=Siccirubricoccus deserti TaxID=2013562 RepID=A0A9X0R137_9PROT|nr:Ldh family oxidoreductase [Siccirubricoccus deserti]MBC4016852.1 Ldh family oxidoreductase [Siccirubricoccus deserti]GGC52442.1 malate dehydrogenase [Siccirubricoccus deserti]
MAKNVTTGRRVPAESIRAQIHAILTRWGMGEKHAATTAGIMVETDLLGVDSHGLSMLMTYEEGVQAGRIKIGAEPRVARDTGPTALLDAGDGLGHPVSAMAMNLAVDKALQHGVGVVGVVNSHHFGAAGAYARIASARGVIGMVTSSTRGVTMVPTRGAMPVLGTNPLAFAAPAKRNNAFVLDMATTTVAAGKVKVHHLNDAPLPEGWVVDGKGAAVTDPHEGNAFVFQRPEGGITPLGGVEDRGSAKGYGLAMLVHILGGALVGSSFSPIRNRDPRKDLPHNIGHFFLAIDPAAFREPGQFENDLDEVIDVLHATPPADPAEPVLVAGEPEDRMREDRLRLGVPVPDSLDVLIRGICDRSGAPYLLRPNN